jgi:hypothetical protein
MKAAENAAPALSLIQRRYIRMLKGRDSSHSIHFLESGLVHQAKNLPSVQASGPSRR